MNEGNNRISIHHRGVPVALRVKETKTPARFISVRNFKQTTIKLDNYSLEDTTGENVSPVLIGLACDKGALLLSHPNRDLSYISIFYCLPYQVTDLDDISVSSTIRLVAFDEVYRASPSGYKPIEEINQNETTNGHVRIMDEKSLKFFDGDGPKVIDGLTFEGGYTDVVIAGDGHFLTADTLWNFKVSKSKLQPAHALQLLMYWRMGLHSIHESYYETINWAYTIRDLKSSSNATSNHTRKSIDGVEKEVIGYKGQSNQSNKKSLKTSCVAYRREE